MEQKLAALQEKSTGLRADLHDLEMEMEMLERRREQMRLELAHVNGQREGFIAAMRAMVEEAGTEGEEEDEQASA